MYKTELMEQILKSKKGQELVQMMSPLYGDAYVALWILEATGRILDEMAEWSESLVDQTRPQTATWSLPLWEKQYGIVPDPSWDMERRRQNIVNKMTQRAPMNPHKLANIIAVAAGVAGLLYIFAKDTLLPEFQQKVSDLLNNWFNHA